MRIHLGLLSEEDILPGQLGTLGTAEFERESTKN